MAEVQTAPTVARMSIRRREVAPTLPLFTAIIVNYKRWKETAALVRQLNEEHIFRDRIEIIVIDNATGPHPCRDELANTPGVKLHIMPENGGFAAGVNAGVRLSQGQWLLVMNPDLVLCPGFVDLLASSLVDHQESLETDEKGVGIVGFRLRNADLTHQYSSGLFPNLGRLLLGLLRPRERRKYQMIARGKRQQAEWVTGSCVLLNRACMNELGGFDEEYFLYYEDVDLCYRARQQGWQVWYDPELEAVHLDPLQNRPLTSPMWAITRHAALTYFRKHLDPIQFRLLTGIVRFETRLRDLWGWLSNDEEKQRTCQHVAKMCRAMENNQPAQAWQELRKVLTQAGMVMTQS